MNREIKYRDWDGENMNEPINSQSCKTRVVGSADCNVVSLFDGMSCLQLALNKAGIIPTKYFASEVDKYAMQVTMANFPNTVQLGDVRNVNGKDLGFIHILAGGSPCQSFSFAGKRKGMATKCELEILSLSHYLELKSQNFEFEGQSYLFWEYMRILEEVRVINPNVKFLLENVLMGEKWQKTLTKAVGINPIRINSALLSAQNRQRLYWTNIGSEKNGFFGDLECTIPQPKDKGILLKDILETDVADKYFLSGKMLDYLNSRKANYNNGKINYKTETDVASCINASSGAIDISDNIIIDTNRKARCFTAGGNSGVLHSQMDLVVHNTMPRSSKTGKGGTGPLSRNDGKTYCLDTGNTNAIEIQCVAMRGRNPENPKSRVAGLQTEQQLEPRTDGKTNCLTSVQKDNLVISGTLRTHNDGKGFREVTSGKGATIPARAREDGSGQNVVSVSGNIRRLTPTECERLQTVPDNYTNHVSDTQRYKMLGNGWTIDVIAYIFSYL
jgi:DNA-cytosine methyltransferase